MDMFLLFVVIFLCVIIGVGLSALLLAVLFRLFLRLSGPGQNAQTTGSPVKPLATVAAGPQTPTAL
ncbi:MAG TPA: hypothetical protein VGQ67_00350 [Candidatus Polarisedimenticolia bacterium]|jgi:hypothetical protein|nr:hypothetical protein [Candidatus Polarisedimenticolia bacterium]